MLLESIEGILVVAQARNVAELIATVAAERPDVVITDISMPGGDYVVESLRRTDARVKIIVLSMHDSSAEIRRALRAGANGYLLKGGPTEEIDLAIRQVRRGHDYFSAPVIQRLTESQAPRPEDVLTERQIDVLKRLARGQSSKEIAFDLELSSKTVDVHRAAIMHRLGLRDLAALIFYAVRIGLVDPHAPDGKPP